MFALVSIIAVRRRAAPALTRITRAGFRFDGSCRDAHKCDSRSIRPCDDRAGTNYAMIPDAYAGENDGVCSDPTMLTNYDTSLRPPLKRILRVMVGRYQLHRRGKYCVLANGNPISRLNITISAPCEGAPYSIPQRDLFGGYDGGCIMNLECRRSINPKDPLNEEISQI